MKIAFTGAGNIGGGKMRGVSVAKALGVPFIDSKKLRASDHYDTIVCVKYWPDPKLLRSCCDRLIVDPLDCWESTKKDVKPANFWRWMHDLLQFDEIIATSPACLKTMDCLLERKVIGHLLPHHADPRIKSDWYDANGPVVYAGGLRFIQSALPAIEAACTRIGRRFLVDYRKDCWDRLQGAALCLHLRLPPYDWEINRHCKPQVKLENAAAAGLPCLATPDPCVMSLEKSAMNYTFRDAETKGINWQQWIASALDRGPVINPVTLDMHVQKMGELLGL